MNNNMKKTYTMPQIIVVRGEYEGALLAGSVKKPETHIGEGGDTSESSGTETGGSSEFVDQGAKEHFNAWTAWDD